MPYTTFSAGAVLTAAQLNTNLRDQAVTPFATTAARDAAITSPVEGMVCVVTGEDRMYVYDGSTWIRGLNYGISGRTYMKISRVANQAIGATTGADISWDTETADPDGFITVSSVNVTIPANLGGVYGGQVKIQSSGSLFLISYSVSGSYYELGGLATNLTGIPTNTNAIAALPLLDLSAGTTIKINVANTTAGSLNYTGTLEMYRVMI